MLKNKLLIVCKRLKLAALQHGYNFRIQRSFSAWLDSGRKDNPMPLLKGNNVERMFTNAEVQKILLRLTGVNLEKIFAERVFDRQERSHFALMTKEMYDENIEKMKVEAKHFLQFVPIKEPRETKLEVLSKEPAIASFDNSKFVFVDITFDATNQNRTVVVRETDGTLRVATPEEHDRMNRVFFAQPDRPVNKPHLFEDPYLAEALNRNEHEYVLDYACYFFEPDDPEFVKLYRDVFDRTISKSNFDLLRSTRHFGPLVFYMVINNRIDPILNYFASTGSLTDTADLIRLYKVVFPNWRVAIGTEDTERKIIFDFLKQNQSKASKLDAVAKLLANSAKEQDTSKKIPPTPTPLKEVKVKLMDKTMIGSSEGPLGELASSYDVTLARCVDESSNQTSQRSRKISLTKKGSMPNLQKTKKKLK